MRLFFRCGVCLLACLVLALAAQPAGAVVLTDNTSFGPTTVVESFEGIAADATSLKVGSGLTLPSGIVIEPQDPLRTDSTTFYVVNGGFFGLAQGSSDVPEGSAYFGAPNPGLLDSGVTFTLPEPARKVGAFVATLSGVDGPLDINALDADGVVIETTVTQGVSAGGWGNNFIGFKSSEDIYAIQYVGSGAGVLRIDLLQYEQVPEPASAAVLLACGLVLARRRRA